MVIQGEASGKASGIRGRLAELFYRVGLLHTLQRLRALRNRDLRILAYHRVMAAPDPSTFDFDLELISTSPERFRQQLLHIKQRFHPMRLGDVLQAIDAGKPLPANAVAVTFDDGYDDNYRIAFPILRELGIPATFFVSTGHIDSGRPFGYDWLVHMILRSTEVRLVLPELDIDVAMPTMRQERRALATHVLSNMKNIDDISQENLITRLEKKWHMPSAVTPQDCRPMNWTQLREMHAAGFEIGSHGVHHRMLSKLPLAEMEREIRGSKLTLDRELGSEATLMSYPVGGDRAFDDHVIKATREAGFRLACCYICGTNPQPLTNRYALYRLPVERMMGAGWFAAMIALPDFMSYPTVNHQALLDQGQPCFP